MGTISTEDGDVQADVVLIDGRNILYPEAWSLGDVTHEVDGIMTPTGGVHGFLTIVGSLLRKAEVIVCWEGPPRCWRYDVFPGYKASRGPSNAREGGDGASVLPCGWDLRKAVMLQEDALRDLLALAGVPQCRPADGEAEDAAATLATRAEDAGLRAAVLSGDSDLLQLVSPTCTILRRKRVFGGGLATRAVLDCPVLPAPHLVPPWALPDLKALAGDSSDDIPGTRGVGNKTASGLLAEHGWSAKAVHFAAQAGQVKGKRGLAIAETPWETIEAFRRIATLDRHAEVVQVGAAVEYNRQCFDDALGRLGCGVHNRVWESAAERGDAVRRDLGLSW